MTSPDPAPAETLRIHGGRTDAAALLYPDAPRPFLDLSTGINPVGYPVLPLDPALWQRLTLQSELDALEAAARAFYRVPLNTEVVVLPGTEIGLRLLPKVIAAKDVCVLGPTYSSHAESWRDNGAAVQLQPDLPSEHPSVTVIVNPNNPDGRLIVPDIIRRYAIGAPPLPPQRERAGARAKVAPAASPATAEEDAAERQEGAAESGTVPPPSIARTPPPLSRERNGASAAGDHFVIIDEAFGETTQDFSVLDGQDLPANIIVLRSVGKFFGLAGLRVGFIICAPRIADALRSIIGAWPIGGAQAVIAAAALDDARWIEATRNRLQTDSQRLASLLTRHGVRPIGGTSLFVLAEARLGLEERLARQGVLIRAFDHSPGRFRFGLPADDREFSRLEAALARSI